MRIENTVEVDAPMDQVWALVNDIPRVAPCMPGAALTGVGDDDTYEGTVAVKLGPLRMSYKGKVTVESLDEVNHSARLAASGRDTKGAGTARANVETRLESVDPTHTRLHVTSDVQLTGKVASFGRGGAINDVATRLFSQFADCLRATLEAEPASDGGAGASATAGTEATAGVGAGAAPGPSTAGATTSPGTAEAAASPGTAEAAADGGTAVPGGGGTAATADGGTTTAPAGTGAAAATPTEGVGTTSGGGSPPTATTTGTAPPSGTGAAGDGTTTAGAAATPATAAPRPPAPRQAEALDAGSLIGTVIKGRLTALFQAIAGFFRRLFGRRRSKT
ncbi:MAG TPA: SRPBCC family protein [Actinomycetota bacterium]|nr:SRPBCC family protein [Actinomycetota bacterium]